MSSPSTSLRPVIWALGGILLLSMAGIYLLMRIEGKNFMDALWLIIEGITTTGFGDVVPSTNAGRIITTILLIAGIGFFTYATSTIFSEILEGRLAGIWGKKSMLREISKLSGHIIVCGAGRVGAEVISELIKEGQKFVVVEKDTDRLEEVRADKKIFYIAGDATEDKVLLAAGVDRAKGVITTLADDAENLLITITCRDINPSLRIVARANRPESVQKLKRSGADTVVCPAAIAGNRMALASLKPASVAFVETLVEERALNLNLEELVLSDKSPLTGIELKKSRMRDRFGVTLLAVKRDNTYIINPDPGVIFKAGDLLILCGPPEGLAKMEKLAAGEIGVEIAD